MSFVKFDYIEPVRATSTVDSKTKDKPKADRPATQPEKMIVDAALSNRPLRAGRKGTGPDTLLQEFGGGAARPRGD